MLENVYEKMYPTCVSSKLCEFIFCVAIMLKGDTVSHNPELKHSCNKSVWVGAAPVAL